MILEKTFDDGLTIRLACPSDNAPSVSLMTDVLASYGIVPDYFGLEADIAALGLSQNPSTLELVAQRHGIIVGVAVLNTLPDNSALLSGIYVSPLMRRQGIGKRLLASIVEGAKRLQLKRIRLETRERFSEAIKLYESTGWIKGEHSPSGKGPEMTYILDIES
jgi:GNAT superfamily N-acetyltransferase